MKRNDDPRMVLHVHQLKNSLSGQQIIDFVEKNTSKRPTVAILTDLQNMSFPSANEPILLNLTDDLSVGTHWSVLFNWKGQLYMFDSYKVNLSVLPVEWRRITKRWNSCGFQNRKTVVCGHYTALALAYPYLFKGKNSFVKCSRGVRSPSLVNDVNVFYLYNKLK